ncbi:transposase [Paenibacillus alvei]|uniref:transposase n=2 Tax=Paenibacillus alvei TaxID=44250 RepID=UPI0018CEEA31|nr:transposase [Paenibacillus alvei]MBG9742865.1 transposase [Paenibacillus alvei]MBG9742957.1 transposase [Paenibacillus alvei]MBG9745090.1 transposase [Paenibacillus alvei]MBG9745990.1 transposase [Paenibacillus alvei]
MGEKRRTYDIDFKRRAVAMCLEEGMGSRTVAKTLGINDRMLRRWITHYERQGIEGLKEKRGRATGSRKGRPKKNMTLEEEVLRLRAENALLKKLWALQRGEEKSGAKLTKPLKH